MANGRTSYVDRLIVSKTGLIPVFYEDNSLRTGWDWLGLVRNNGTARPVSQKARAR